MGSNCGKDFPNPDTSNVCSPDPVGSSSNDHTIPNFCTLAGAGGNNKRSEYCGRLGNNEWSVKGQGGSCNYNDCNNVQSIDSGCCDECCGIAGAKVVCKRVAYNGDPARCCLQDYDFPLDLQSQNKGLCFDKGVNGMDTSMQNTCDPQYRNVTSSSCQTTLLDYCTGADLDPSDTSWLDRWQPNTERGSCSYAVSRNLFVEPLPLFDNIVQWPASAYRDNEGYAWSRELMGKVFEKYSAQGFRIGTPPGLPGYNPFQNTILQPICTTAPGICQQGLTTICSNTTTGDLLRNPGVVPWCGCYMPNDQYQTYTDLYQVNKECTPACARQGNIPVVSADGRQAVLCNQDVCIIDNVTISLENTNVGGSINFSQFCGGCSAPVSGVSGSANDSGTGNTTTSNDSGVMETISTGDNNTVSSTGSQTASSCLCIISDGTISAASSSIGGGINLNEDCGSSSQCYKQNPDPTNGLPLQLPIDCDGPPDQDPYADLMQQQEEQQVEDNFRRWVIIAIIVIGVIVLILFMLYLSRLGNDTDEKVIPRRRVKVVEPPNAARVAQFNRARSEGAFAKNVSITDPTGYISGAPLSQKETPLNQMYSSILDRGY